MLDLSLAISHHLLVFMLFGILFAELVLVRPGIDQVTAGRVAALDLWYGVIAAVIILVGFSRAIFAAKRLGLLCSQCLLLGKDRYLRGDCIVIGIPDNRLHEMEGGKFGTER
jgi:putative membrane protein